MRLGRGFTAVARQAPRLAQGAVPLDPGLRAMRAERSEESNLIAGLPPLGNRPHGSRKGQCPLTPDCARCAQSARRKAAWLLSTAARQQASRLAGLVWLCASWIGKAAVGRQALRLAVKVSVDLISRWPFALRKNTSHAKASPLQGLSMSPRQLRGSRAAIGSEGKKARLF